MSDTPNTSDVLASEPNVTLSAHPLRSKEWYNDILCKELGYESLRDWQLKLTMALCDGRDAVCIIATGAGKSALIQGPILAHKAAGKSTIGLVVVPTKGLADDQADAATVKGIHALALHKDATRAARAETPARSLFEEIRRGKWSLVFLSPEMLTSTPFRKLLKAEDFTTQISFVTVDECHLSDEWKDFRTPYQHIKRLRHRLPSCVAWLALSGTISPEEFSTITEGLGFHKGQYELVREHVDRPTIKYVPRLLSKL